MTFEETWPASDFGIAMAEQKSLLQFEDGDTDEFELREACGVFGCVAAGEWPSQVDVPHTISVGLVGLQHR